MLTYADVAAVGASARVAELVEQRRMLTYADVASVGASARVAELVEQRHTIERLRESQQHVRRLAAKVVCLCLRVSVRLCVSVSVSVSVSVYARAKSTCSVLPQRLKRRDAGCL